MKIISKKYWQDMKNFVEQISIKFGGFLLNQDELSTNCAVDKNTKISVEIRISADIQKVKYRPIISVDRYIGRSLVHTRENRCTSCCQLGVHDTVRSNS